MSCAANPPAPAGYRVWRGAVPADLTAWAVGLRDQSASFQFGQTWTKPYNGQTIIARLDHHPWHYAPDGTLLTDRCWRGITLYAPIPTGSSFTESPPAATDDPLATPDPTIAVFDPPDIATGPNWPTVAFTATAIALVIVGFVMVVRTKI